MALNVTSAMCQDCRRWNSGLAFHELGDRKSRWPPTFRPKYSFYCDELLFYTSISNCLELTSRCCNTTHRGVRKGLINQIQECILSSTSHISGSRIFKHIRASHWNQPYCRTLICSTSNFLCSVGEIKTVQKKSKNLEEKAKLSGTFEGETRKTKVSLLLRLKFNLLKMGRTKTGLAL